MCTHRDVHTVLTPAFQLNMWSQYDRLFVVRIQQHTNVHKRKHTASFFFFFFLKVAQCCICALQQPRDAETIVCLKWSSQHGIWRWFPLCRPSNNLHHQHLLTASEGNKCPYWTELCVFLRGMFKNSAALDFPMALAKNIFAELHWQSRKLYWMLQMHKVKFVSSKNLLNISLRITLSFFYRIFFLLFCIATEPKWRHCLRFVYENSWKPF